MRVRRGKTFVVFTMVLSVAVLLGGVIASKDRLREEWFLRKLDSKDKEEREFAIEKLGELRSSRAVPRLVELAKNESVELLESSPVAKALIHIGSPAVRALLEQ